MNVELTRHIAIIELKIDIVATVEISCDRCLEEFMLPVVFEGNPLVKVTSTHGADDGDTIWVDPQDDRIELAQYIYESIILSLPFQRVHPRLEDCNPEMVKRFSIVTPEQIDEIEQRAGSITSDSEDEQDTVNPFAVLEDLKDKL